MHKHHRIYCPACGRRMKLAEHDFHERIICTACGAQFDAPLLGRPAPHPTTPTELEPVGDDLESLHEHVRASTSLPRAHDPRSFRVLWVTLCVIAGVGLIAAGAV